MTDQEIIDIAEKHGLTMRPPLTLIDIGNGMSKFVQPKELTFYGTKLVSFAQELLEKKQ